jgi:hypothetical protein
MYTKLIFDKVDRSLECFNRALKTIDCDSRFYSDIGRGENDS